jgi:hypothetical protein
VRIDLYDKTDTLNVLVFQGEQMSEEKEKGFYWTNC